MLKKAPPLWRNLSFSLMWTSVAASGFGDRMMMIAALVLLGGLVEGQDTTAIQASTQFFFFLPYLFASAIGGWLADHMPRKWLLMICDEARGLLLLLAAVLLADATGVLEITGSLKRQVYGMLFLIGTFAAIFNPARAAIVPQIVSTKQLQSANAIILVIGVVFSMIGVLTGKVIINANEASTVRTGLLIGMVLYLVSGTFYAFMHPMVHRSAVKPARRSMMQALRYTRVHRRVLTLILINICVWASAALVSTAVFGVSKIYFGLQGDDLLDRGAELQATMGFGMLFGSIFVVLLRTRRESPMLIMIGLIGAGTCVLLMSLSRWMPLTFASAAGVGIFGNIAIIAIITLIQSITPNYMRGRVLGLNATCTTTCSVITYFAIWRTPGADRIIIYAMFVLGPALMLLGIVGMVRHLRRGPLPSPMINALWRVVRLFVFSYHRLEITGKHHVPRQGGALICSNHTVGLDPMIMQAGVLRVITWVMTTNYLFKPLDFLWRRIRPIALNREKDLGNVREILRRLKAGELVGLFPEGGVQRTQRELKPFEPGVGMIARRSGVPLVPCWIDGTPRANNMLWHFFKPSQSTVRFGPAFTVQGMTDEQAVAEVRRRILVLQEASRQARDNA